MQWPALCETKAILCKDGITYHFFGVCVVESTPVGSLIVEAVVVLSNSAQGDGCKNEQVCELHDCCIYELEICKMEY